MKHYLLTLAALLLLATSYAQQAAPVIQWQKCIGGTRGETATGIVRTTDGNFVVAGHSSSNDGDVGGPFDTTYNAWILKIDIKGEIIWKKKIRGSGYDYIHFVTATPDGGCITLGQTNSNDGDITDNHGVTDMWVIKLDAAGNIQWKKCYGGTSNEQVNVIRTTSDGGYIFAGGTNSNDGDVSGNHGGLDIWIVKIDATGAIQWQKCYGGTETDFIYDIQQLNDGTYAIAGSVTEASTDFPSLTGFPPFSYLAKLDASGNKTSQLQINSQGGFNNMAVLPVTNNELLVADVVQTCSPTRPSYHTKIYRCVFNGSSWTKDSIASYGNCGYQSRNMLNGGDGLVRDGNNKFIVFGSSNDTTGYVGLGGDDGFISQFTNDGSVNPAWELHLGGNKPDAINGVVALGDNEYLAVGHSNSDNRDVSGNKGGADIWIVKLGKSNVIKGTVFLDLNSNGIKDAGENFAHNYLVESEKPGYKKATITVNGVFSNIVDTGTYTTRVILKNNYYTIVPATRQSSFTNYLQTDSFSFALQPVPNRKDLQVSLTADGPSRPGFSVIYRIWYANTGTAVLNSGPLRVVLDKRLSYLSAMPGPDVISGDTLTWNLVNISPQQNGTILLGLQVAFPPNVFVGDTLITQALIDSAGDVAPADNASVLNQRVIGAVDPNDKQEVHGGMILPADIAAGKPLSYTIRFQNTGTDTAFNIIVRDTLDANLDWSSLQMIDVSHPYTFTVQDGRYCTWTFTNVLLPDSNVNEPNSHGHIVYRIKPKSTLVIGNEVKNNASIYFDFNLPVVTNTVVTTVKPPPPVVPVITGLQSNYCSQALVVSGKISNLPPLGSGITVTVKIDNNTVGVGADSSFSFNVSTLATGAHTASVQYTNATASRISSVGFTVTPAVNPDVNLSANITNITSLATNIIVTAVNDSGGGTTPLYTFARDRNFSNIAQPESVNNTWTFSPSTLAIGDNLLFVKMKTSATCFVTNTAIDSILLKRSSVTGINDPDMPGLAINVYPNPFRDAISINGLNISKTYTVRLFNLEGKQLVSKRISGRSSFVLPRQRPAAGIYWLSIYDETKKRLLGTVKLSTL